MPRLLLIPCRSGTGRARQPAGQPMMSGNATLLPDLRPKFRSSSRWIVRAVVCGLLSLLLAACGQPSDQPDVRRFSGSTMGTYYTITLVAEAGQSFEFSDAAMQAAIEAELAQINQIMSTYIPDSELMQLNAAEVGVWQPLSAPLYDILQLSQQISGLTQGAFDVTVGPLVNLWGFGPDPDGELPTAEAIAAVQQRVGYQQLELEEQRARKQSDIFVDLSGIAKGYGVDWLGQLFDQHGVSHYLINIGGDLLARGVNPDGEPWRIAIEIPSAERQGIQRVVPISNVALVTSGDYRNYRQDNGQRRSHIIDPTTGYPVNHSLASVTVIADTAAEADALATAMMVMGTEAALALAEQENHAVVLIERQAQEFKETYSSAFTPYR